MTLLNKEKLEQSWVVANNQMNRKRTTTGINSYEAELNFNPIDFLKEKQEERGEATWLDLCCGEGNALIEAAKHFSNQFFYKKIKFTGIDLVGMFAPIPDEIDYLNLMTTSIFDWQPKEQYDLITCVHGLHYLGDKLEALKRVGTWLKTDGLFVGHLDTQHIEIAGQKSSISTLKKAGFQYHRQKHLLTLNGGKTIHFESTYLGADDSVGANYTGQYAVKSFYQ